jgi:hypothetical protein
MLGFLEDCINLDSSLQLEAVYYTAPMPRTHSILVALGLVFDRIHLPGTYFPQGDYDRQAWQKEIDRIADVGANSMDAQSLLALMRFTNIVDRMPGFFAFNRMRDDSLDKFSENNELVDRIYEEMWGAPNDQFTPVFSPWHHKSVSDSKEHLTYPGAYYYQAGALQTAGQLGLPLISDEPRIPIPGNNNSVATDAKALSSFIALQAMSVALSDIPLLAPDDLMEFRDSNAQSLRAFRRAMLRYAGEWRGNLEGLTAEQAAKETEFLVQTEIVPALDELRQLISDPARPWHRRAIDGIKVTASIGASCLTGSWDKAIAELLTAFAPQFFKEIEAKGDKTHGVRRSDLYYLIQIQRANAK